MPPSRPMSYDLVQLQDLLYHKFGWQIRLEGLARKVRRGDFPAFKNRQGHWRVLACDIPKVVKSMRMPGQQVRPWYAQEKKSKRKRRKA